MNELDCHVLIWILMVALESISSKLFQNCSIIPSKRLRDNTGEPADQLPPSKPVDSNSTLAWITTFVASSSWDDPDFYSLGFAFRTFDTIHMVDRLRYSQNIQIARARHTKAWSFSVFWSTSKPEPTTVSSFLYSDLTAIVDMEIYDNLKDIDYLCVLEMMSKRIGGRWDGEIYLQGRLKWYRWKTNPTRASSLDIYGHRPPMQACIEYTSPPVTKTQQTNWFAHHKRWDILLTPGTVQLSGQCLSIFWRRQRHLSTRTDLIPKSTRIDSPLKLFERTVETKTSQKLNNPSQVRQTPIIIEERAWIERNEFAHTRWTMRANRSELELWKWFPMKWKVEVFESCERWI